MDSRYPGSNNATAFPTLSQRTTMYISAPIERFGDQDIFTTIHELATSHRQPLCEASIPSKCRISILPFLATATSALFDQFSETSTP